ncbi:MAG: hypothetical protein H5T98_00795 [Syntrophomonadaceae bacterium]|nr:hypothetical protein [Syntrophomonadaceae bacterium]
MNGLHTITNPRERDAFAQEVRNADVSVPLYITVSRQKPKPKTITRSNAQNALMWMWLETMGSYTGDGKDGMHSLMKKSRLLPLMCCYPEDYPHAPRLFELSELYPNDWAAFEKAASTADLSVEHFTIYLNELEQVAGNIGARLQYPEDIYAKAMGRFRTRREAMGAGR